MYHHSLSSKKIFTLFCLTIISVLLLSACSADVVNISGYESLHEGKSLVVDGIYWNDSDNSLVQLTYETEYLFRYNTTDKNQYLASHYYLPITANGMKWALGYDWYGHEVLGWVREVDLELGAYKGIPSEVLLELQQERAERFRTTGEYRLAINLYSNEYATEVIGIFLVLAYPEGQAITLGIPGMGIIHNSCDNEQVSAYVTIPDESP